MNILFYLTRYPGVGGIETVTTQIVGHFVQKQGYTIDILSHRQQQTENDLQICNILCMPNEKQWTAQENISFACNVVKNGHYDVIIYQDSYAPTEKIVCYLSKEYNIPLIVFEHNSPLFIYNKRDLSSWLTPKGLLRRLLHAYLLKKEINRKIMLLNQSSRYVLLSEAYIPEFCTLVGCQNDGKVTYINNPVMLQSIHSDRIKKKENTLLYVGRLVVEKGVDKMLKVWAEISKELSTDWQFIIVGDGPERTRLERLSVTLELKNIRFEGFQDPQPYYERAKLFIMMSKYEGWGLTLCEAMSQGVVPIVLNSFSAAQDIIKEEINGYLADNEQTCSQQLLQLMNNPQQLTNMSIQAVAHTKKYSINNIIPQWEDLLNDCR
ncbi:glycosyltransferase [Parabacteroides sp.]